MVGAGAGERLNLAQAGDQPVALALQLGQPEQRGRGKGRRRCSRR
jgi:hypothetical protein